VPVRYLFLSVTQRKFGDETISWSKAVQIMMSKEGSLALGMEDLYSPGKYYA
jgi:hypothetical protein